MQNALIVIDIQNDYFPDVAFTLENAESACKGAVEAIEQAKRDGWLLVGLQHVNPPEARAFVPNSEGVKIHPAISAALGEARVVTKHQADSFFETDLEQVLRAAGLADIYLTGIMTHPCVKHTALAPQRHGMHLHIRAGERPGEKGGVSTCRSRGADYL